MNNESTTSWTQIKSLGIGRVITIALGKLVGITIVLLCNITISWYHIILFDKAFIMRQLIVLLLYFKQKKIQIYDTRRS